MSRCTPWIVMWVLVIGTGCGEADQLNADARGAASDSRTVDVPSACQPTDINRRPTSIEETVALMNALPSPVTVPCLLESLERPLRIHATQGMVSAQPADSAQDPRIFIFSGPLILSVVTAGKGAKLLELSEVVAPARSIKGELYMPAELPIEGNTPFEHLAFGSGTLCGMCHRGEKPSDLPYRLAYVSDAYRSRDSEGISMERLREQWDGCQNDESDRCAIYRGIFGHGEVVEHDFDPSWPTLVNP